MELLKERIRREGKVLPGNIIKVDGFLNHRVDTALMRDLADEFAPFRKVMIETFCQMIENGETYLQA
mgnify:FL=1